MSKVLPNPALGPEVKVATTFTSGSIYRCAGNEMTRFKERQRIENAIKNRDVRELEWAVKYCEMRIPIATMKQHVKHWTKILEKVKTILDELNEIQA
jgi:hypothetical protein